ncbi:MAG TPA: RNA-guided endonuclease TnpB family protein [Candidatus Cybelea sp.]|nr:RNA-guided endonuclease TnpB family protein [Candidatus Cybelea sp.]
MTLAHRIRLVPSADQEAYFRKACGVARFAYNWALAEWQRQHAASKHPNEIAMRRSLNAVKHEQFPWMREVTKNAPQQAIKNLGRAYANFFAKRSKYPLFKKKGKSRDAFRADNGCDTRHPDAVLVDGKRAKLPVIGWVKMREEVRFAGQIVSVTISREADAWHASFTVEVPEEPAAHVLTNTVGVDLGVSALATRSDGSPKTLAPKPLRRYLKKLKRLARALSRKQRGSANRVKAKTTLARLHARIGHIRHDALHKLTTDLARNAATIVIEDLNVVGMLANRKLSRAIADLGFFEFRRQLEYKNAMAGGALIVADRWYPSSKLCSACNVKNALLTLSERTWTCVSCGASHDRDVNAAVNLARYPESWAGSACGAEGAGGGSHPAAKPAA